MSLIKSIAWEAPDGQLPQEGDLVKFVPFNPNPLRAIEVTGRLVLDQDTSGGKRRWTIEYDSDVSDGLIARCYSSDGALVLLGRYPDHVTTRAPCPPVPQTIAPRRVADGVFGLSWAQIELMQGGKLRHPS